jgi:hypothetical protein
VLILAFTLCFAASMISSAITEAEMGSWGSSGEVSVKLSQKTKVCLGAKVVTSVSLLTAIASSSDMT